MNKIARGFAKKLKIGNARFVTGSVEEIPLDDNSQDLVLGRRTGLSHDMKWNIILREIFRILKKEGIFIYTVDKAFKKKDGSIKKELHRTGFEVLDIIDSHKSDRGTVCMVISKPIKK